MLSLCSAEMPGNFYAHFAGRRCVMAGSRIKGITVEISGDTTKLHSALKGVNSEIKNTQSQLKDVEKLLKLDPGNTELLAQKQKLLSSAVSETKESSLLSRLLQNWQIRHLRMVTFPKNSTMLFRERSSKQKKLSKSWRHRRISLPLLCRRLLLLVKA